MNCLVFHAVARYEEFLSRFGEKRMFFIIKSLHLPIYACCLLFATSTRREIGSSSLRGAMIFVYGRYNISGNRVHARITIYIITINYYIANRYGKYSTRVFIIYICIRYYMRASVNINFARTQTAL